MQFFLFSSCFLLLLCQAVYGLPFGNWFGKEQPDDETTGTIDNLEFSTANKILDELSSHMSEDIGGNNSISEYRSEQGYSGPKSSSTSTLSLTDTSHFQSTDHSTGLSASNSKRIEDFTENFNETHSNASTNEEASSTTKGTFFSSSLSTSKATVPSSLILSVTSEKTPSSTIYITTSSSATNGSSSTSKEDEEPEGVVIRKSSVHVNGTTITQTDKTMYQRTLEIITDTYTLSILVPVAAGVLFATAIILTIASCRCLKRRCRRRRLRNKVLPDSVKNLRPSDRARLLAESSDEEF